MSISFECPCGKKMAAKEEFAGRRLRCPECQRVVTIPKESSGQMATSPNLQKAPSNGALVQPTLTKSEVAALEVTRPIKHGATPLPKPTHFDSPENLEALFGASMSSTPILIPPPPKPPTAPMATPAPPGDELTVTQIVQNTEPFAPTDHPWADRSFEQMTTPWRPGDEQRFQAGIAPAREWDWPVDWIVPILVVAASIYLAV